MELESLKGIWAEDKQNNYSKTEAELFRIIETPSRFPIRRMLKSVRFEILLSAILYSAVSLYFLVELNRQFILVSLFMGIWGLIYILYLLKKQQLLRNLYSSATPLRTGLQHQVVTLQKYIKLYLIAGTVQLPVTMLVLFLIYLKQAPIPGPALSSYFEFLMSLRGMLLSSVILLITGAISYCLNNWYVQRLYGQHLANLKMLLNELERED